MTDAIGFLWVIIALLGFLLIIVSLSLKTLAEIRDLLKDRKGD